MSILEGIQVVIRYLEPNKTLDLQTAIKNLPTNIITELVHVINLVLRLGHFPKVWNHPIVRPAEFLLQNSKPMFPIYCLAKIIH